MAQHQLDKTKDKSTAQIDRMKESQLQSSLFRPAGDKPAPIDLKRLRDVLKGERQIPSEIADQVCRHMHTHLEHLGLANPSPNLILHWLAGLLREHGYTLGESSLQSLELSLSDVEWNIYHPVGFGAGADQNPEFTSQRIAQRIKSQFACRRIFQEDVIRAHDEGAIELLHLGAIDRPHDVFLTPDYLKTTGPPVAIGAPSAGSAKRADVLLGHMIRFTHELQNHFAGDIQWGYVNTLLLPFVEGMSPSDLRQFVQQMLFEFGQLDMERGALSRKVTLDFDLDLPRQLRHVPVLGPGGRQGPKTYRDFQQTLHRFNEVVLEILDDGDHRGNPFHSPRIVYHVNNPETTWGDLHQNLLKIAAKFGNPSLAFSFYRRDFGPLGLISLNDPEFLKTLREPSQLRGFSTSSIALNLVRLASLPDFELELDRVLDFVVTAHRQKRLFIARLMAYGNRGPLQFLRHKIEGKPFLKIDHGTQPMHLVGLGEAAAMRNGSPISPPAALGAESAHLLDLIERALKTRNRLHKLNMFLCGAKSESVAYRFAYLDLHQLGQTHSAYLFRQADQAHPIYTEGPNILAFSNLSWRERLKLESQLHARLGGSHGLTLYLKHGSRETPDQLQRIYQEAQQAKITQLQFAPDMRLCMSCFLVVNEAETHACPECKSTILTDYGLCQSHFSAVSSWCLGKRSEWRLRHRLDDQKLPVQTRLPWG